MLHLAFAALGASAPSPCTISGTLAASGAGPTVTSATRTITVPGSNSGAIRIQDQNMTGTVSFEYSKNGGAWTSALVDPTELTFANGDTLAVRIGLASSGESMAFNLVDNDTSTTIGAYFVEVP